MIPIIQVDEARFTKVAARGAEREIGDGASLKQARILEEIVGAVFGSITLWYLVTSLAGLA
ncbi:hypothetical protein [Candidatus Binatus sp.]|jgi:hypothetical protein|uniref:hypothetical protein n=1 Tax=Candidatus Binatus sp. TaxID=2811406 RepID=UPI003BC97F40